MRRILCSVVVAMCLVVCGGCSAVEGLVSDVGGWDVSACVDGFDTCWELFSDNADKFEDGFVDALGGIQ